MILSVLVNTMFGFSEARGKGGKLGYLYNNFIIIFRIKRRENYLTC